VDKHIILPILLLETGIICPSYFLFFRKYFDISRFFS
jgi:hypothetical protein